MTRNSHPIHRWALSIALAAMTLASCVGVAHAQSTPNDQGQPVTATPPPPEPAGSARFGYGPTGLFAESADGRYRFQMFNLVQPYFEFVRVDGGSNDDETNAAFQVRRARTAMHGNVFSKAVQYFVQVEWGRGGAALIDAEINLELDPEWFSIKVGQYRLPTSRQLLVGAPNLEMVERAITQGAFLNSRDIGFALHNGFNKVFEYSLGLYNGTGAAPRFQGTATVDEVDHQGPVTGFFTNVPTTFRPLIVARVGTTLGGINAYTEGDLTRDAVGFGVGLSGFYELDVDENDQTTAGGTLDFIVKAAGFSATGAASLQHFETDVGDTDIYGGFVQAGYAFEGGELATFQPVVRYAAVVDRDGDRTRHEAGGGLSVYFAGHRLKLQTDAFALIDQDDTDGLAEDDAETVDARVRAQLSIMF